MISYFFRNKQAGISIQRVYASIAQIACAQSQAVAYYLPCANSSIRSLFLNVLFAWVRRNSRPINHVTGDVHYILYVLPSKSSVVTVHDVGFYTNIPKGFKRSLKWLLWIRVLKRARKVVCISEFTKQQLVACVELRPKQVEVVNNPLPSDYRFVPKVFDSMMPRILHVGTAPNKNLERTVRALSGTPCHLRIVGRLSDAAKAQLVASGIDWSNVYGITDEEMLKEYQQCDVVNFPSLFEGFGMPIIEAQAVGRLVVTSNREPMKGIAGDGAALVDPECDDSIRIAYQRILEDPGFRDYAIQKGLDNVKRYSVECVYSRYQAIYREILADVEPQQ